MINLLTRWGKKAIPRPIFEFFQPVYHWKLAWLAALYYGFPSKNLYVIGVTGTNGKSTVVDLLHAILSEAGESVASASSIRFKIKNEEKINALKMTMPGRFQMQKFLREVVRQKCKYAVLEVTSEGIKQFRNNGIKFSLAILTNVTPEHIESHGGFEKYRATKARFFYQTPNHILNGEDTNIDYFVKIPAKNRIIYTKKDLPVDWHTKLLGDFNKENIVAAYQAARFLGISPEKIKLAIEKFEGSPGRLEFIQRDPFAVVVDYAHTPDALEKVYKTLQSTYLVTKSLSNTNDMISGRLICVFGAAGGGRDKWKRQEMGKIAATYCDEIILTNEDPYDENPMSIINDVDKGIARLLNVNTSSQKILDRKEAIRTAISKARPGDVVIITGKGCEPWLMGPNDTKIPWDDREIVRDMLK